MAPPWIPFSRRLITRTVTRAGAVVGAAQIGAAAGVMVADALRRRREAPIENWPTTEPSRIDAAGSAVTTYTSGRDLFPDMLAAIREATESIFFETYIWKSDDIGEQFKQALIEASNRGVQVYVVYDGFANLVVPPGFYDLPPEIHVLRFRVFRPRMALLQIRHMGRDHRKLLVIDGEVGFVGGYNVGDDYAHRWRDTHVRVEGPAVWELSNAFTDFWNDHRSSHLPELPDPGALAWESSIRAARNAPSRMLFPVRGLYLTAIDRAALRIWITQAYFIPDHEIQSGLLAAARRGVDVRILMPEYSNHVIADWVARGYYQELLAGGVQIWLYQGAMVHAKTAVVDGLWSTVGTANIDRLSLIGNYEINLEVYSENHAQHLEEVFERDLTNARRLTLEEWEQRGALPRAVERLLAPWHPMM